MTKSGPYSIRKLESVDTAVKELNNIYKKGEWNSLFLKQSVYSITEEGTEPRYKTGCFSPMVSLLEEIKNRKKITEPLEFSWYIPVNFWMSNDKIYRIYNYYVKWIKSHPDWVEGFKIKRTDNTLTVSANTSVNKLQFLFVVMLLRKLVWYPHTVVNWYRMVKSNLPYDDLQLNILSHGIKFHDLIEVNRFIGLPDSAHFLVGRYVAPQVYLQITDPAKVWKEKPLDFFDMHSASSNWLDTKVSVIDAANAQKYQNDPKTQHGVDYDEISRNW